MRESESRTRSFARNLRSRMTEPEIILWSRLRTWRAHGCNFRRQHPIGPYIADFACVGAKLVVELDGDQHGSHRNRAYDQSRDAYMEWHGWQVVRIPNDRIFRELGEVLDMLSNLAVPPPSASRPPPPLFRECAAAEAEHRRGGKKWVGRAWIVCAEAGCRREVGMLQRY